MKRALLLAAAALALPRAARAADSQCAELIVKVERACEPVFANRAAIKQLSATVDELTANAEKIAELKSNEQTLLTTIPLGGMCARIAPEKNPRTCSALADLFPSDAEPVAAFDPAAKAAFDERLRHAQQPDRQTSTNKSGSAAQSDPVESIQPINLAGGAVTLSGTRSGSKGVGTITINPLALLDPESLLAGRLLDLGVSAPIDLQRGTSDDRRYVSGRLRVNLTAPLSVRALDAAVTSWLAEEGKYADDLEAVLTQSPDVERCVQELLRTGEASALACGSEVRSAGVESARARAFSQIELAQRAAEAYYVGVDARVDHGDPTGTEVVGDKGTHALVAAAAGGRIALGARFDLELRGRVGFDYFRVNDDAVPEEASSLKSLDGGAAVILSGLLRAGDKHRIALGVGVEGRYAGEQDAAELAPTNYVNLNFMLVVPSGKDSDVGLSFSVPACDSTVPRGTIISLSTDLGILDHPHL